MTRACIVTAWRLAQALPAMERGFGLGSVERVIG